MNHPFYNMVPGILKDTKDNRDFNAEQLIVRTYATPPSYRVDPHPMIYNQGQTPECGAFSGAGIKTDEEYRQWGKRIKFNAPALYAECKKTDGIPNQPGTYPRVVCQVLQQQGIALAGQTTPDPRYKIDGYYRIMPGSSIDFITQLIFQFGSIMLASEWYSNWMGWFRTLPKPSGKSVGGHAYRGVGWESNGIVVANSYGKLMWGWLGIAVMPWDIVLNYVLADGDSWKLCDAK